MSQNLISLTLSDEQLSAVDAALGTLEEAFTGLIALNVDERRSLNRMGAKSEQFCRQTLNILGQNPQIIPLADAQADHDREARRHRSVLRRPAGDFQARIENWCMGSQPISRS